MPDKTPAPTRILVALTTLALTAGCATTGNVDLTPAAADAECVVLLHGLNGNKWQMRRYASALEADGYSVANVGYPSRSAPIEDLIPVSVDAGLEQCRHAGARRVHFVTHSLGGILLRYAQEQSPIPDLGRVVMLAPPNKGSEIVDVTGRWPGARLLAGPAAMQLGTRGEKSIPARLGPVDFELGVIAGYGAIDPLSSAMLPNPDDGKVTVASTRVEGMRDFMTLARSHRGLRYSDEAIENTRYFLRTGRFVSR